MIDLRVEKPILLKLFGRHLPEPRDYDTIRKWWKRGLLLDRRKPRGKRVKLETCRIVGGLATTLEAYARFLDRLNEVER